MKFLTAAHTDIGIIKEVNQDAFCLKVARTPSTEIAFAVLCDGMGGLNDGELASAFVVNAFSEWFENILPTMLTVDGGINLVKQEWERIIAEQGRRVMDYGRSHGSSLGTTLTVLLALNGTYIYAQVGDSRLYKISDKLVQLTKDQTYVAQAVEQKRMTLDEAKVNSKRNVLLQCIGASKKIVPEIGQGRFSPNDVFMLCSDGFRHEVYSDEMYGVLAPQLLIGERVMKQSLIDLVELNKSRKENDNITALLIKAV